MSEHDDAARGTTLLLPEDAQRYITAVRTELDDLSPVDQGPLLEDLTGHLRELSTAERRRPESLLGPPAAYAVQVRESAGLPPRPVEPPAGLDDSAAPSAVRAWWTTRALLGLIGLVVLSMFVGGPVVSALLLGAGVVLVPVGLWLSPWAGRRARRAATSLRANVPNLVFDVLATGGVAAVAVLIYLVVVN